MVVCSQTIISGNVHDFHDRIMLVFNALPFEGQKIIGNQYWFFLCPLHRNIYSNSFQFYVKERFSEIAPQFFCHFFPDCWTIKNNLFFIRFYAVPQPFWNLGCITCHLLKEIERAYFLLCSTIPSTDISVALVMSVNCFLLTQTILLQTITWKQPPKAGPVRTSSDPPDCPPTPRSHMHSQSLTTTHTPAPPGVSNTIIFWLANMFFTKRNVDTGVQFIL